MRTSVCSTLALLALAACGSDTKHQESFPSPFGDPGSNVVCGPGTYLAGQQCLPEPRDLDAGMDAGEEDGGHFELVDSGPIFGVDAGGNNEANDAGSDSGSTIDVDVTAACLGGGNVFVIAGNDYIHSGPALYLDDVQLWTVRPSGWVGNLPSRLQVQITHDVGVDWSIELKTNSSSAFAVGEYADVQRAPFAAAGHPGLEVYGEGAGCNMLTGKFTVLEIDSSGPPDAGTPADGGVEPDAGSPRLRSFTATFEQHCEGGSAYNVGCIHVEAP